MKKYIIHLKINAIMILVNKFIENKKCTDTICTNLDDLDKKEKLNICYVRVSLNNQKDDLMRHKTLILQLYLFYLLFLFLFEYN